VDYEHDAKQFVCPCHGARYDIDGKVLQGPAKRNLRPYSARLAMGLKPKA
jgi:cytochrome b6-f complex iron-sulfur subunit